MMKYEIISLPEKTLVGIGLKTSNSDPQIDEKIGTLWNQFFNDELYLKIKNKKNDYPICLYSDYDTAGSLDVIQFKYDVTIGYDVTKNENIDYTMKKIPAGNYAKFMVKGNIHTAVASAWQEIWSTPLNRSYIGDFEEYLNESMEEAEVAIYIALKD